MHIPNGREQVMEFCKKTKGHLGQYEDWWSLDEKDGVKIVTHEWSHTQVNGLHTRSGQKQYTVEEFLEGDHYSGAQAALREVLKT